MTKITKNYLLLVLTQLLLSSCYSMSTFPHDTLYENLTNEFKSTHKVVFDSLFVDHLSSHFHYLRVGNASKSMIVLIHGSPDSWESWSGFLKNPKLQQNFEMVTFDRLGYGLNRPGIPELSLKNHTLPIAKVIEKLKQGRKVIVVGYSFGGPIAAKLTVERPDLVDGVVLVGASMDPEIETPKWYQYPASWKIFRWMMEDDIDVCNREILALTQELAILKKQLHRYEKPTVVVHGGADSYVPIGNVDYIRRQIGQSIVAEKIVEKMNHYVVWENANLIEQAIYVAAAKTEQQGIALRHPKMSDPFVDQLFEFHLEY